MTAFIVIGTVGLALLLLSVVAGEFLDGLFEAIESDLFSGTAIGAFLAAFGSVGLLVVQPLGMGVAIVAGLVGGLLIGGGVIWISRVLRQGGDEDTVRTATLAGKQGAVVTDIPADGFGQVSVTVAGHITRLSARASVPLPAGTQVTVTDVLSSTAVRVAPLERSPGQPSTTAV